MIKKHKEHELILVQKALADKEKENAAAKIDAKYKLIKFYERRKITRKLAGLQRALANLFTKTAGDIMSAEEKGIRKEMQKWQNDADYIDVRITTAETCVYDGMRAVNCCAARPLPQLAQLICIVLVPLAAFCCLSTIRTA